MTRPVFSRTASWVAAVILLFLPGMARQTSAQRVLTPEQWREDLRYLAGQIPRTHPRAFHHITRQEFDAAVADLDKQIPSLSDDQVEVALVRLVALLGEGHSRLSLPGLPDPMSDVPDLTPVGKPRLAFHRLPVKLYLFSDGLFVVSATPELQRLVGAQVINIAGRPARSVLDAVQPLVNQDNEMGARLIAPDFVVVPELLHALHVVSDPSAVTVTFRMPAGTDENLRLLPLAAGAQPKWVETVTDSQIQSPLYRRHRDKNLWTEYLVESGTLFVRVNVMQDMSDQSVAKVAADIDSLSRLYPVDRFVIDLRDCHGGDNQKFRALLLEVIRNARINQPGRIFTLINRATFSAAVNAATDLERLSNSIFVGEPTAGAPSSWGDPRKITLPNSGLVARISTIYWRDWTTDESRPWLAPDLQVGVSSTDYFAGRDPAMDAVIRFPNQTAFEDVLANVVRAGADVPTIVRLYYQRKTDALWADQSTEGPLQRLGALLVANRSYGAALLVFEINLKDYPGSRAAALETVRQAQEANPHDDDLAALVTKLKASKKQD